LGRDTKIESLLKAWLDNVLVPIMVREYLATRSAEGDNSGSPRSSENAASPESEQIQ
jgi:hypothetical protein